MDRIVLAVNPQPGDRLLEIGPGQGAMTFPLLKRHGALTAIEFDRDLLQPLAAAASTHGTLTLIPADVLAVDFTALAGDAQLRLVGNLPYNLSSPIMFHALEHAAAIRDMHFMLQKEVIDRIVAQPGGDMGRLTVMLQAWYQVETLFDVPPEAFDPPPKVQSSVIRMLPRPAPLTREIGRLQALLAVGFSQRRKMIRNTLGKWLQLQHPDLDLPSAAERQPLLLPSPLHTPSWAIATPAQVSA